jgi:hypothetical protein
MLRSTTPSNETKALTDQLRQKIERAVLLTADAQLALREVAELAKAAFDSEAWKVLGYEDFEGYCQSELFIMGYIKWTLEQRGRCCFPACAGPPAK